MLPVAVQFHAFVLTGLTGVALGVLFDLARLGHHLLKPRQALRLAGDVALWILGSCLAAVGLYLAAWGELRQYALVAGGLGMLLYFLFASATLLWAAERLLRRAARRLRRIAAAVHRMVVVALHPFAVLGRFIARPFHRHPRKPRD